MPIQTQNRIIYIQEHKGGAAGNVLRIRQKCIQGNRGPNIGSICLGSERHPNTDIHHLDLTEDLINDIGSMGGNFFHLPATPLDGALCVGSGRHSHGIPANPSHRGESACWAGATYVSWRGYRHLHEAVSYLKRFFEVKACPCNQTYDQAYIDKC